MFCSGAWSVEPGLCQRPAADVESPGRWRWVACCCAWRRRLLFRQLPQAGPTEDAASLLFRQFAPGLTVEYGAHHTQAVENAYALVENGEAERVLAIIGFRGVPERAFTIVRLKDWEERERTQRNCWRVARAAVPGHRLACLCGESAGAGPERLRPGAGSGGGRAGL